jgi:hypothetical protein
MARVSQRKNFAEPIEPHTWFDAFETPEERALRTRVRGVAWEQFEHLRDEITCWARSSNLSMAATASASGPAS